LLVSVNQVCYLDMIAGLARISDKLQHQKTKNLVVAACGGKGGLEGGLQTGLGLGAGGVHQGGGRGGGVEWCRGRRKDRCR